MFIIPYPTAAKPEVCSEALCGTGGRLAYTIPKRNDGAVITVFDDACADWLTEHDHGHTTNFSEEIMTGYRWNGENGIESQLDFGYGLSCTTLEYADLAVPRLVPRVRGRSTWARLPTTCP